MDASPKVLLVTELQCHLRCLNVSGLQYSSVRFMSDKYGLVFYDFKEDINWYSSQLRFASHSSLVRYSIQRFLFHHWNDSCYYNRMMVDLAEYIGVVF